MKTLQYQDQNGYWRDLYNPRILEQIFDRKLEKAISKLKNQFNPLLELVSSKDGKTYGIKNGNPELICDADEVVLTDYAETPYSIAMVSLATGKLAVTASTDAETVNEVKALLGDDIFNELAAGSVKTLDLVPAQLSMEQKLQEAKAAYLSRKEIAQKQQTSDLSVQQSKLK